MIAALAFSILAQVSPTRTLPYPTVTRTPTPSRWFACPDSCAPCPPNTKPYITYTDPYNVARYMRFDAGIQPVPPGTCTPRWVGQGGPDHADLGLGADCKHYPLATGDHSATWHYPAPPPEANLCAFYPGPESCPTGTMEAYSKRIQANPVWIESLNTYKPTIDADCKGPLPPTVTGTPPTAAPTFTRTKTWTPTTGTRTPNVTQPPPDDCILSGRTCTPTPTSTRSGLTTTPSQTRTPVRTASATPTATAPRFTIAVKWTAQDGRSGSGTPICVTSSSSSSDLSSGYWFFSPSNIELFISVLPSYCSTHPNVMIKLFGGTNVKVDVTVTDRQTGKSHTYTNPQGQMFVSVIDTVSLPCR